MYGGWYNYSIQVAVKIDHDHTSRPSVELFMLLSFDAGDLLRRVSKWLAVEVEDMWREVQTLAEAEKDASRSMTVSLLIYGVSAITVPLQRYRSWLHVHFRHNRRNFRGHSLGSCTFGCPEIQPGLEARIAIYLKQSIVRLS